MKIAVLNSLVVAAGASGRKLVSWKTSEPRVRTLSVICIFMIVIMGTAATAPAADTTPPGAPTGMMVSLEPFAVQEDMRYEAEDRTAASGCNIATNNDGYTGYGFMDFGGNGTWIEWNDVYAARVAAFELTFRYANGGAAQRPVSIIVNGRNIGSLPVKTTGGWTAWETDSVTVTLEQGANTVRVMASTDKGGPNLDGMVAAVSSSMPDLCPDDPYKTAPGDCGCGVTEGTCSPAGEPGDGILLPIEVFGGAGTREEVSVALDDTGDIDHLYLRCHACGYHIDELDRDMSMVKAQVQINSCQPVDLKAYTGYAGEKSNDPIEFYGNPDVTVIGPEAEAGGLGGAFRVARMTVKIDNDCLKDGDNTITFIHKNADPHQLGFRIIEMNLLRDGNPDKRVLPASAFVDDDPMLWRPIYPSPADIEEGRRLFSARNSLYDLATDLSDGQGNGLGPNNGMIRASCGDCHTPSGRGFAYFNFTDSSLVKGAMSHQLTRKQGEQIASFIRSRNVPRIRQARPWNPPYQPGPGLDARPVAEWAAGAGIDAILERDEDTLDYLFPNGTSYNEIVKVVDRYGTLNLRELPTDLAMPHWGAWLPPISPIDAFDLEHEAVLSDENGKPVDKPYFEVLYENAKNNPTRQNLDSLFTKLGRWWARGATCYTQTFDSGPDHRAINGVVTEAIRLPHARITPANCEQLRHEPESVKHIELVKRGLMHWMAVRLWEIIHANGLEEEGAKQTEKWCSLGRCVSGAEPRGWVTATRDDRFDVYHLAPHYIGYDSRQFTEKTNFIGIYENNQWYHLQMILNPGYREVQTSHWAYTHIRLYELAKVDRKAAARLYATFIKMRQLQTNGHYGGGTGLSLRYAQPFWYFSGEDGERVGQIELPGELYSKLYEALTWDFLEAVQGGTQEDWANAKNNNDIQPRDSTDFSLAELGRQVFPQPGPIQGRNTYRLIDITSRSAGLDPRPSLELQLALCDWGQDMWPEGPWDALRDTLRQRY